MELRDLYYFEIIAEFEHVGRAAQYLHRSQPALTSCLRRLEEAAGGPLIQKKGRGIQLTPAGRVLYDWARRMRLNVRDATLELRDVVQGVTGEVRMGFVASAAQFIFPRITRTVLEEMPDVQLKTVVGLHEDLTHMLRQGELDFMVVGESYKEPGFFSRAILEDSIVPVAIATHPVFQIARPGLKTLCEYDWILQPPSIWPRQWLDQAFDRAGLPRPRARIEINMLNLQPELIAESRLLGFLPRLQLMPGGRLREVKCPRATMTRRLELRYREGAYLSPVAARVIELLTHAGKLMSRRAKKGENKEP